MSIGIIVQLFVMGFAVSSSFCLLTCTPLFYFILSIKEHNLKDFIYSVIKLNIIRFFTFLILSLILYLLVGRLFAGFLSNYYGFVMVLFGVTFVLAGFSVLLPRMAKLVRAFTPHFLGFASGLNLCLPKVLAMGYVFVNSNDVKDVLAYSAAFAFGEVFSPFVVLFLGVSYLKKLVVERFPIVERYLSFVSFAIFIALGLVVVYSGIKKYG